MGKLSARFVQSVGRYPEPWIVALAICAGVLLKLVLVATSFGTNDIAYWIKYARFIAGHDSVSIYQAIPVYNHPPLISGWISVLNNLAGHDLYLYSRIVRLHLVVADIISAIMVWKLTSLCLPRRAAMAVSVIFALSPVMIMISGFHGNTDPILMCLVLVATLLVVRGRWMLGAAVLGLACNVKIVPVLTIPAFFFWIRPWNRRLVFVMLALGVGATGFAWHYAMTPEYITRNVFMYSALQGIWGLGRWVPHYGAVSKYILFGTIVVSCWLSSRMASDPTTGEQAPEALLRSIALTFLCFFVFTGGFGVQYLAWIAAPVAFLGTTASLLFNLVGGIFLFRVYTFWAGGFPWDFANSDARGPWRGFDQSLDATLWVLMVVLLAAVVLDAFFRYLQERTSRKRAARPLEAFPAVESFDAKGKRIAIFVISYNASAKIQQTLARIPPVIWDNVAEVFVIDDCSTDNTYDMALAYKKETGRALTVIRNKRNHGYGANQKVGYRYAISRGHDIVVMLHADGQYAPELMGNLLQPLVDDEADMVFGSRMLPGCDPLKGGMPPYKYLGNIVLTKIENFLAGMHISEFHSGYRAYSLHAMKELPFEINSDSWHFDTEILLECDTFGKRIAEVPIVTYYGDEICHVNGIPYAINCIIAAFRYRLVRWRLWHDPKFDVEAWQQYPYQSKLVDPFSNQSLARAYASRQPAGSRILEISPGRRALTPDLADPTFELRVLEDHPLSADGRTADARKLYLGDVDHLDWSSLGAYDVIIMADVLAHSVEPAQIIEQCVDHLSRDGRIFVCIPNVANWYVRLQLLLGRFEYGDRGILDRTHLRFFTRKSALALLFRAGLVVTDEDVTPIPLPLVFGGSADQGPLAIVQGFNYLLTRFWPSMFAYQMIFYCKLSGGLRNQRPLEELENEPEVGEPVASAR